MLPHLDERQRRMYLASEAEALGEGGATEISRTFGIHLNTLTAGKRDLNSGEVLTTDDGNTFVHGTKEEDARQSLRRIQKLWKHLKNFDLCGENGVFSRRKLPQFQENGFARQHKFLSDSLNEGRNRENTRCLTGRKPERKARLPT